MKIDIQELVREAIIPQDVASKIEKYYKNKPSTATERMVFIGSLLGGLLISAGVILLFAHNWDNLPKSVKLSFSFLPLFIGQLGLIFGVIKTKSKSFIEGLATFLFLSIGASIALVSQIYHISGDLPSFLMTWALLGLPLVYLVKSSAASLIYLSLVSYYSCAIHSWYSFGFFAAALPHFIHLIRKSPNANFTTLHRWLIPIVGVLVIIQFVKELEATSVLMFFIYANLIYLLGVLENTDTDSRFKNGFRILGGLGMLIVLFSTSYWSVWDWVSSNIKWPIEGVVFIILLSFIVLMLLFLRLYKKSKLSGLTSLYFMAPLFVVVYFIGLRGELASIGSNLLLVIVALESIRNGLGKNNLLQVNFGLMIILLLAILRFFDADLSIVLRGIFFVLAGTGFIVGNYVALKKKNDEK